MNSESNLSKKRRKAAPRQEAVASVLRKQIETGVLKDGQTLPPSRQLAKELDVSTFTIYEAIKILAAEGFVETKSRSGSIVTAPEEISSKVGLERPRAVFVAGYDGSGKSEFADELAGLTGWPVFEKDEMLRALVEEALVAHGKSPNDRESEIYRKHVLPKEEEVVDSFVQRHAKLGQSVIVVAPYVDEVEDLGWLDRKASSLQSVGAALEVVWLEPDESKMFDRVRQRGAARDAKKLDAWDSHIRTLDLEKRPVMQHFVASGQNSSASEFLQRIMVDL